ncbi:hypothetical protein D9M72_487580 [compost metagenome]
MGLEIQLEQRIVGHRLGADATDRGLNVLRLQRIDHVGWRQVQARHAVDVEDDAHGVVLSAEELRIADAGHALDRVEHVDRGVVGQEQAIEVLLLVRSKDGDHLHQRGRLLAHADAALLDLGR